MRWVQALGKDGRSRAGVLVDDEIRALEPGSSILELLHDGDGLAAAGQRATSHPVDVFDPSDVELQAPLTEPPSIRDFMAFEEHVQNSMSGLGLDVDPAWYRLPVFYFTNPGAVHGPNDPVAIPPLCERLDYELEVAAIVGREGRDLSIEAAAKAIAGLTILNDWSARDLQVEEMRIHLGPAKGKDFATTLGPTLVTVDELAPRRSKKSWDLQMTASVNGKQYSQGNLGDLWWSFAEMIAYASRGTRVRVGDVIGSGTVGSGCIHELSALHGPEKYPWLMPGDEVVLAVEGLGEQRTVVSHPSAGSAPGSRGR